MRFYCTAKKKGVNTECIQLQKPVSYSVKTNFIEQLEHFSHIGQGQYLSCYIPEPECSVTHCLMVFWVVICYLLFKEGEKKKKNNGPPQQIIQKTRVILVFHGALEFLKSSRYFFVDTRQCRNCQGIQTSNTDMIRLYMTAEILASDYKLKM